MKDSFKGKFLKANPKYDRNAEKPDPKFEEGEIVYKKSHDGEPDKSTMWKIEVRVYMPKFNPRQAKHEYAWIYRIALLEDPDYKQTVYEHRIVPVYKKETFGDTFKGVLDAFS